MRKWKCPHCGKVIEWSYNDLADAGTPICNDCDFEMELEPED